MRARGLRARAGRQRGEGPRSTRARTALLVAGLLVVMAALGGGVLDGWLGGTVEQVLGIDVTRADSALAASATQVPTAGDAFAPELGLPAREVVAIGAAPNEAPGEVWAYGQLGNAPAIVGGQDYSDQYALLERTAASGWQVVPLPPGPEGKPLAPVREGMTPAAYNAAAGQTTAAGGVVLLSGQNVVVRDPGGQPQLAPAPGTIEAEPPPVGVLAPGESLLPTSVAGRGVTLPYAALEDTAGASSPHTGVLVAPYHDGGSVSSAGEPSTQPGVLHYDGGGWTREPIELASAEEQGFVALALACGGTAAAPAGSSPLNCWLLAGYRSEAGGGAPNRLALFRRVATASDPSGYVWQPQSISGGMLGEQSLLAVTALGQGAQMLTVTAQGAWVDFQAKIGPPAAGGSEASDVSELVTPTSATAASVLGTWCYPTGPGCAQTLGAPLPAQYRSFAWPGASASDPGTRVITGLPDRAMLELAGGSFAYTVGAGGEPGVAPGGAAFDPPSAGAPWEGWIADGVNPANAPDGAGQSQVIAVTQHPEGDQLQAEAVPFRRPLYAVAQQPGTTPGDPHAQAVAVGEDGQIARYEPGLGWRPEALYDSSGKAQTPTLRGVAWPEPGRAYAVGDNGAMWVWRAETGLWEPDPAEPFNFIGNLTAIAFSPSDPQLGYAVGKQGALLKYGKSWEQVQLPAELQQANFTAVTFAGGEALATYRMVVPNPEHPGMMETGGVAVEEDGSGLHWHVDPGASALLAQLPGEDRVLAKIAGLADGGAVAAGPGKVIERESASAGWRFSSQPLPEARNISALAAYRDSAGTVRAIVSVDLDGFLDPESFDNNLPESPFKGDVPPPTGPGQPPVFLAPDPLPGSGYLLKETASGWSDMEHEALPASEGQLPNDMPIRPDPVLALLTDPSGTTGLAVGGETGDLEGKGLGPAHVSNTHYQTAAALRFPAGSASAEGIASPLPVTTPAGEASFVVAGQAACAHESCADSAAEDLGPDVWLTHALQTANTIATGSPGGLHAFLYTGGRLPARESGEAFTRGLERYATLLGGGGSLPVYAADSEDTGQFTPTNTTANYSSISSGPGGPVVVIVLDCSSGEVGSAQREWLREQLAGAKRQGVPAIVMGNAALGFTLPDQSTSAGQSVVEAKDASAVAQILVEGGASAYFFDYPGANVKTSISYGTKYQPVPVYGTGTLGYVSIPVVEADALGSSGLLLASVDTAARSPATNVAPVSAEVVPNISQLALDATEGVLLRRSQVALFEALARRPPAGVAVTSGNQGVELAGPDPYDQIPFDCQGPNCAYEVPTQYTFTSSNPDIANFVAHDSTSSNPRQVKLGSDQLPIPDSHSGLLCAFNEGTTIVSITTGGLTYSEPMTVQGGSVEYPCGTVPLKNPPRAIAPARVSFANPSPAPANPPPTAPQLQPVPPPPAPAIVPPPPAAVRQPAPTPPFLPFPQPLLALPPAIVPPLSPTPARPTPPSGTAQVFEPMAVTQREREEESAEETASQFSAYDANEGPWPGSWLLPGLLVVAAGAGITIGRSGRRRRYAARGTTPAPAPARASASAESTRRYPSPSR